MSSEGSGRAVVIGSGVGGLLAAIRLGQAGWRPTVIEAADQVGGRFSTHEVDGYRVPTGAIAIERGGAFMTSLDELGIAYELRYPDPAAHVRIKGATISAGAPTWEFMIKKVTKSAARVAQGLRSETVDDDEMTLAQWTRRHTSSRTVLTLVESLSRTLWTVNADELPAQLFFETLRAGGGYKTFGLAPQGNIVIARAMAAEVERLGGSVRTGWSADTIELAAGRAVGVLATSAGGLAERLSADAVVSNAGPAATARMLARTEHEAAFAERAALAQPTSMLSLSFATGEDLLPRTPGILNFTDAERLSSVVHMTATCPDLAPPGRHLYEAYSVPRPSIGGVFDDHEECELLYADLRRALPGFTAAETIHLKVMRGANPALRAGPQGVPSVTTPVPNLVEVGDGVRPRASTGTSACALTAIEAVAALESTVRRTPDAAIA